MSLVTECHLPECGLRSITEAPEEASQEKTPRAGWHCLRCLVQLSHCGPFPPVPPSFPGVSRWLGGLAIPWNFTTHATAPPPLLPQTLDIRYQTDVGAHLSSHTSCSESYEIFLSSTCSLPVGLSSQGTALRPPSPHPPHDGQKILLAWSCRATQSLTTGGYCSLICAVLFPLWLAPGSNLFITIDRTHPR